ncbi:hypothetical protein D3C79_1095200 [compost metagenome]
MQAAAFVPRGHMGEAVRGFEDEFFEQFHRVAYITVMMRVAAVSMLRMYCLV